MGKAEGSVSYQGCNFLSLLTEKSGDRHGTLGEKARSLEAHGLFFVQNLLMSSIKISSAE